MRINMQALTLLHFSPAQVNRSRTGQTSPANSNVDSHSFVIMSPDNLEQSSLPRRADITSMSPMLVHGVSDYLSWKY